MEKYGGKKKEECGWMGHCAILKQASMFSLQIAEAAVVVMDVKGRRRERKKERRKIKEETAALTA